MSIQVGDILRVVAVLSWLDGDVAMNVFNAVIGGSGGPYDDADVLDDAVSWVGAMYAEVVAEISDNMDGSEVRVYIYDSVDDDWDEVGINSWTFNPTGTAENLPRGCAALINARSLDPDVNGKKYLPGFVEGFAIDGLWSAGTVVKLAAFGAEWATAFTGSVSGASWVPAIWSPTDTVARAMNGTILVPSIVAYQRRRKDGVGI